MVSKDGGQFEVSQHAPLLSAFSGSLLDSRISAWVFAKTWCRIFSILILGEHFMYGELDVMWPFLVWHQTAWVWVKPCRGSGVIWEMLWSCLPKYCTDDNQEKIINALHAKALIRSFLDLPTLGTFQKLLFLLWGCRNKRMEEAITTTPAWSNVKKTALTQV